MEHKKILEDWLGERYREPNFPTYECVGWVKKYCTLRGWTPLNRFGGVGAYQGWINNNNTFSNDYERIENKRDICPIQGDIIIFKPTESNKHGHIAIVEKADLNYVNVIEQNGAQGDGDGEGGDEIRLANYTYKNVIGWYRYKTNEQEIDRELEETIKLGFWSGKRQNELATRAEVAKMCFRIYNLCKI